MFIGQWHAFGRGRPGRHAVYTYVIVERAYERLTVSGSGLLTERQMKSMLGTEGLALSQAESPTQWTGCGQGRDGDNRARGPHHAA